MIRFSDLTLIEAEGNFGQVTSLMLKDGVRKWMLRSDATITGEDGFTATYVLHFWNDGRVCIHETTRPTVLQLSEGAVVTDSDLVELKEWAQVNGWKQVEVSSRLLTDPRSYDFWKMKLTQGLVASDVLQSHIDRAAERQAKAIGLGDEE